MKTPIAWMIFLLSAPAGACINQIPESEVIKAIALAPNAGAISCAQRPAEPCICFDGIDWEIASYVDVQEDDPAKPIYESVSNVQECKTREQCETLIAPHCPKDQLDCQDKERLPYCSFSPDQAFYRATEDVFEAYCTHVKGFQKKIVKKLVDDPVKKSVKEARIQIEKDSTTQKETQYRNLKQRLKSMSGQTDLTAADIKEGFQKLLKMKELLGEL